MEIRRRPPNPSIKVANLEYAIPHPDSQPKNILEEIVWEKHLEVEIARKKVSLEDLKKKIKDCLLYTSPSPRDVEESRMPSSA